MTIRLPDKLESSIREAVDAGQFRSVDDAMAEAARLLIRQLKQQRQETAPPSAGEEAAAAAHRPIWEEIQELTAEIPDEVWDKLPTDLSEQHDHYIYGTPKRPTA